MLGKGLDTVAASIPTKILEAKALKENEDMSAYHHGTRPLLMHAMLLGVQMKVVVSEAIEETLNENQATNEGVVVSCCPNKFHKLSGLKQHKFINIHFWRPESNTHLTGLNPRLYFFSGTLGESLFPFYWGC